MAVVGKTIITDTREAGRPARGGSSGGGLRAALYAAAFVALALGALLWIVGAWYTLRGWVLGINLVVGVLGIGSVVSLPGGRWVALVVPMGVVYSLIEVYLRPARKSYARLLEALGAGLLFVLFVLWAFVVATDIGSTYLSVITPAPGAWALTKAIAVAPTLAGAWTLVLTFLPELFFVLGWALLEKAKTWIK